MGIYWCAVDDESKERISPPDSYNDKTPGLYHPSNPFPGMVIMKNSQGYNFELVNDGGWDERFYSDEYKDITDEVYKEYLLIFDCNKEK